MEIKTSEQLQLKEINDFDRQFYSSLWLKRKWVAVDDVLLDMKGWLEANDFAELKQCISGFVNELEEKKKQGERRHKNE